MLRQRVLSALVGIPLIIAAVWIGNIPLLFMTAIIMIIGLSEITVMLGCLNLHPPMWLSGIGSLILLGSAYLYKDVGLGGAITLVIALVLVVSVLFYPKYTPLDGAGALLATLYIGLFIYFYLLRSLPEGWIWLVFMLVTTWASDTTAYFIGKRWGKRQLAPTLSPGKTLEGGIGGLLGSVALAGGFAFVYSFLPLAHLLLLGLMVGIAGQVGDLVESAFKRQAGVKDSGRLIPGHGGVLDRFDSMLFTAPLVYYYVLLFILN